MRVLILSAKDDNGGIGIATKRAFERHAPEHVVHSVTREDNFIGWERDIFWKQGDDATQQYVQRLFDEADVVHIMDVFEAAESFRGYDRKPKVFHHHGLDFRRNAEAWLRRCDAEGIRQVVATIDLLKYAPDDLTYLPNPCDIPTMQWFRSGEYQPGKRTLVVQSPTSLTANNTDAMLAGVRQIEEQGVEFDLDVIQHLSHDECMRRKARADIVVDSFTVAYGLTSIEAWGMGIPVIHGSSDTWVEDKTHEILGYTPYLYAQPDTFGVALANMIDDTEMRDFYSDVGWQAVNDFHAEPVFVRNLLDIYEQTIEDNR